MIPARDDLSHVGRLVETQAEDRGKEVGDQAVGDADPVERRERDADGDLGKDGGDVEPEEDLNQHRRTAEEPDVEPAHRGDDGVLREPHHRQQDPENDADRHGDRRQLQGDDDAFEDLLVEQVGADHAPVQQRCGGEDVDGQRHKPKHQHREDPAPRVPHRDRLDRLRPRPRGGRRHRLTCGDVHRQSCARWWCSSRRCARSAHLCRHPPQYDGTQACVPVPVEVLTLSPTWLLVTPTDVMFHELRTCL